MFTAQNILLISIVALFLMNFQTIMGIFIIYFMKLRDVVIVNVTKDEIPSEVKEIIQPYEELLLKNGFVYKSAIEYNNMYEAVTQRQHTFLTRSKAPAWECLLEQ